MQKNNCGFWQIFKASMENRWPVEPSLAADVSFASAACVADPSFFLLFFVQLTNYINLP
jgi:hypothetical protein